MKKLNRQDAKSAKGEESGKENQRKTELLIFAIKHDENYHNILSLELSPHEFSYHLAFLFSLLLFPLGALGVLAVQSLRFIRMNSLMTSAAWRFNLFDLSQ